MSKLSNFSTYTGHILSIKKVYRGNCLPPPPLKKGREKKTGQKLVILKQFQNSFKILQPVIVLKLENCYQSNLEVHDVLRDCMLCCNEENTGYCIFIM